MAADVFVADGVLTLPAAFSPAEASLLRQMIWRHIESSTPVRPDDRDTWGFAGNFGLGAVERRAIWHTVHDSPAFVAALDEIFGAEQWCPPGPPQILLTFPSPPPWTMPTGWHIDGGWNQPTWPVHAVKMFVFLDHVVPMGGGTLLLKGSHRLVEQLALAHGRAVDPMDRDLGPLQQEEQLTTLLRGQCDRSLLEHPIEAMGAEVTPVELTGEPGDIVLTHMHVFHSPSPAVGPRPRQMLGNAVSRITTP